MLIYFRGKELRFNADWNEYLVLKGAKVKGHQYVMLFRKRQKNPTTVPSWGWDFGDISIESRFGSDLWESIECTTNDVDLDFEDKDGDGSLCFTLGGGHMIIPNIQRWSVRYGDSEYVIEIPNNYVGPHLTSIEPVDKVLEYLLKKERCLWQ